METAGTVYPEGEEAQGDLIHVYKLLMGGCREGGTRLLLLVVSSDRMSHWAQTEI